MAVLYGFIQILKVLIVCLIDKYFVLILMSDSVVPRCGNGGDCHGEHQPESLHSSNPGPEACDPHHQDQERPDGLRPDW